jgi:hypothetical protein
VLDFFGSLASCLACLRVFFFSGGIAEVDVAAVFDDMMLLVSIAFSGVAVRLTAQGVFFFYFLPVESLLLASLPVFPVVVLSRVEVVGMMDE